MKNPTLRIAKLKKNDSTESISNNVLIQLASDNLSDIKSTIGILKNSHVQVNNRKAKWLNSTEVLSMLNISIKTLQRLRISNNIKYCKMRGRYRYKESDVLNLLSKKRSI